MAVATYLSAVEIAERLGVPPYRVRYLLLIYAIQPAVMVGAYPGYTEAQLDRVREVLPTDRRQHVPAHL